MEQNCRDCLSCKVKQGIIRCVKGCWIHTKKNCERTMKTKLKTIFRNDGPLLMQQEGKDCPYFESMLNDGRL